MKTMVKVPINVTPDGCAFSLTATLPDHAGMANLTNGGGHFPCTGVLEYEKDTDKHDR